MFTTWPSSREFYTGVRCRKIVSTSLDTNWSWIILNSFAWTSGYITSGCCTSDSVWWRCVDVNIPVFFTGVLTLLFGAVYLDVEVLPVTPATLSLRFDPFTEPVLNVYIVVLGVLFLGNIPDRHESVLRLKLVVRCGIRWRSLGDGRVSWVCVSQRLILYMLSAKMKPLIDMIT